MFLVPNKQCSEIEKTFLKQSLRTVLVKFGPDCKACFGFTVVIEERTEGVAQVVDDYKDCI